MSSSCIKEYRKPSVWRNGRWKTMRIISAASIAISAYRRWFVTDAKGAGALDKLSRYETTLMNNLHKAMGRLAELQDGRVEQAPNTAEAGAHLRGESLAP